MRAEAVDPESPQYAHDCAACTFLGRYGVADLYHCLKQGAGLPTVISRHSSVGPDYTSGMVLADTDGELHEARERARIRGLKIDIGVH